jgi:hypothetical protein
MIENEFRHKKAWDHIPLAAPLAYGSNIHETILSDIQVLSVSIMGFDQSPVHVARTCASMCSYPTLAIMESNRSSSPSDSNAFHNCRLGGGGGVESAGGRVAIIRALKPREKEGGKAEKRCVWNVRVKAEKNVGPSLHMALRWIGSWGNVGQHILCWWRPCLKPLLKSKNELCDDIWVAGSLEVLTNL